MKYVNVYILDQEYGGPEEGGWYYTSGRPALASDVASAWNEDERAWDRTFIVHRGGRVDPRREDWRDRDLSKASLPQRGRREFFVEFDYRWNPETRSSEEIRLERPMRIASFRANPKTIERLERWAERQNRCRPSMYSVLSEGVFSVRVESHPAREFPDVRPHYE